MQQALFETPAPIPSIPSIPPIPTPRPLRPAQAGPAPLQRWWRLQGEARRRGRAVEPMLVTPRFLARIDTTVCPVTREPLGPGSAQVVALRPDATLAAGHLVTLSATAAAAWSGRTADGAGTDADTDQLTRLDVAPGLEPWVTARRLREQPGARAAGLDAAAWGRLAVLCSFVQPLTPAQAAALPLLVLPPNRVRVLSPVQGLQVAATLALRGADRAVRLLQLAALPAQEEQRQALRVLVLTLLARCPAGLDERPPRASRQALEDLWLDPLLQRRWERLARRLTDAQAESVLHRAHATRLLGPGWRPLEPGFAVDGWDLPAGGRGESRHVRRNARGSGAASQPVADRPADRGLERRIHRDTDRRSADLAAGPERRLAGPVLDPDGRRHGPDAGAPAAVGG